MYRNSIACEGPYPFSASFRGISFLKLQALIGPIIQQKINLLYYDVGLFAVKLFEYFHFITNVLKPFFVEAKADLWLTPVEPEISFDISRSKLTFQTTVELQWLLHLWNHENMFKTGSSS